MYGASRSTLWQCSPTISTCAPYAPGEFLLTAGSDVTRQIAVHSASLPWIISLAPIALRSEVVFVLTRSDDAVPYSLTELRRIFYRGRLLTNLCDEMRHQRLSQISRTNDALSTFSFRLETKDKRTNGK